MYLIFGENACKTNVAILSGYSTVYCLTKCRMICKELTADANTLPFFWIDSNSQSCTCVRSFLILILPAGGDEYNGWADT